MQHHATIEPDAGVLSSLATTTGLEALGVLARLFAESTGADGVLIAAVIGDDWSRLRVLATHGLPADVDESARASLGGGPWRISGQDVHIPEGVRVSFPGDPVLDSVAAESLVDLILTDTADRPNGLVACVSNSPLPSPATIRAELNPFLSRTADEMRTLQTLEILRAIVETTGPRDAGELYRALVNACVHVLSVDVAYVASLEDDGKRARTRAIRDGAEFVSNFTYDLAGTPCARIYERKTRAFIPHDVQTEFPDDEYLRERGLESYLAFPLFGQHGEVIGHLGLAHRQPLQTSAQSDALLESLAARAAAELRYAREQRERAAIERKMIEGQKLESLGLMAGGIAHDFNNLIMVIQGNASLAMKHAEHDPGSPLVRFLREIQLAARRSTDLAAQMLAYAGRGQLQVERVDLSAMVEELTKLLQVSLPKKVELRCSLSRDLPPMEADATQVSQVLLNLVINAAEAIGDEAGVVTITTRRITCEAVASRAWMLGQAPASAREHVCFEISDTGSGIDTETLNRIFDPFFTTKLKGRGLGLAAVLGIVRRHGGALDVASRLGRGTTFTLIFPSVEASAVDELQVCRSAHDPLPVGAKILLVDDEESVSAVTGQMLTILGAQVTRAPDGPQAIEIFRERRAAIDLVLLDMNMPKMGGLEVERALRRIHPEVRVIFMSGYDETEALGPPGSHPHHAFLQKPFGFEQLRAAVGDAIGVAGDSTQGTRPDATRSDVPHV